ncbi:MAG: efflux RND transporter periplasmic adaptor subunit [Thermoanaerobaculia bacterium]|nr:efflux RND transporter periplasmic adaptor subunit [Thermoanaerobaculia bacterium]
MPRPAIPCFILCLPVLLLAACGPDEAGAESREDANTPYVEVVQADEGTLPLEERVSGVVRAENQVAIRPEIEAPIIEVLVRNGESVERGQPLVRQDPTALREQMREMEAALRLARAAAEEERARVAEIEARVRRSRTLAEEELISEQELETLEAQLAAIRASATQAVARVEQAEAALGESRSELGRATIRAPISGTIGRRDAEVGMIAGPGDVLFVIGDLDDLIVEVPLTEEMLRYVETGQTVRIHSPRLEGGSIEGTLARISPFLEAGSFSTVGEIEISNPDGRLHPGTFVQVDLLYGESERATLVPTSAIWEDPETGELTAWVLSEPDTVAASAGAKGQVERREIAVIGQGRLSAAIGGVAPDEWVVVIGQHLFEGESGEARLRSTTWERVAELQNLQREDLLENYLAKQQRLAQLLGARPLSNEEFLGSATPVDPENVVPADEEL